MIQNSKLILGPPGCGKTYRLIQEIEEALTSGVHPSRIGVISFTRKAIEEMISRACLQFNLESKDFPYMRTSHSLGFHGLGLQPEDVMKLADYKVIGEPIGLTFEKEDAMDLDDGLRTPNMGGTGQDYVQMDSRARYRMVSLEDEFSATNNFNLFYAKAEQFRDTMQEYKRTTGKVDFIDMIERYVELGEFPHLDYLFVDEAQDFTPLQWEMVKGMSDYADNIIIAGDDDQAVHRWTGVDVDLFINSSDNVEYLTQSYRIPRRVHELAQGISSRIYNRLDKTFSPREEQGTVEYVYYMDQIPLNEGSWTIMARTNYFVREVGEFMKNAGFKYSIKGRSSISETLVENLTTWDDLCKGEKVGVERIKKLYAAVPKQGEDAVVKRGSAKLLDALAADDAVDMDTLLDEFGLLRDASHAAYDILKVSAKERDYIEAIYRRGEDLMSAPRIKLSTFHAMKGGEDDNCVVLDKSTAACVNSDYPDDEHRAFYVGVTRARHNLYILLSGNKYRYPL